MKRTFPAPLIGLFLLALLPVGPQAQSLPATAPTLVDPTLTRLFEPFESFSADAELRVYDRNEQEVVNTAMQFSVRDGQLRMEVDLAKLKSKDLPAGAAASLKPLGMDQVTSLILPDRKSSYVIYPGLKSMLRIPLKENELKSLSLDFKKERQEIGRETLDGHPCVKHRLTLTDASGARQEALTWNATDLKEFPVQIQTSDGEHMILMRFRKVNTAAPNPALFRLPVGYAQYESQQDLLQAVLMKALSGLGAQ